MSLDGYLGSVAASTATVLGGGLATTLLTNDKLWGLVASAVIAAANAFMHARASRAARKVPSLPPTLAPARARVCAQCGAPCAE